MDDLISRLTLSLEHTIGAFADERLVDMIGRGVFDDLACCIVPPIIRTLCKNTGECKHVLSIENHEFVRKREEALRYGSEWKDRSRDGKGQLFRMRMDAGRLVGWSGETQTWVLVLPQFLQTIVSDWVKDFYLQCNEKTRTAYANHEKRHQVDRDFSKTVGERASLRGVIAHRRDIPGRRNHFIKVPKVY